ncbi:MAG: hypothetical protein ACRD1C_04055 [Terriglobales bacterium]
MSALSASLAPSPASQLPLLWHDHLLHRHASRAHHLELNRLAHALASRLHARLTHHALLPYPQWLASLSIPLSTSTRLLALLDPRPAPPAATLAHLQLSVRLSPLDSSIARGALQSLDPTYAPQEPPAQFHTSRGLADHNARGSSQPGAALNCGRIVAEAFLVSTQGDLRHRLRSIRDRHPDDFNPQVCAALPPILVPAPPADRAMPPILPDPDDTQVRSLYSQFLTARRAHRLEACELSRRLPLLGRLLALKQHELATAGRASHFSAFLRHHHIPRPTAYRLINNHAAEPGRGGPRRRGANDPNCLEIAPSDLELHATSLTLRLTPQQTAIIHAALTGLLSQPRPLNISKLVISAFLNLLPADVSAPLYEFWASPPPWFRLPRFLPPLQLRAAAG